MADFKFKLNAVLDMRKRIEDQRKKELAELKELLRREQVMLHTLDKKRKDALEHMKQQQTGLMNISDFMNYYTYLNDCREKIISQISLIKELIAHVDNKREDLICAAKDRKIIEKLRENQYQEFKDTMEKIETKMLDEIATNGFNYRNNDAYAGR
jgi:flagellar protein FliJ